MHYALRFAPLQSVDKCMLSQKAKSARINVRGVDCDPVVETPSKLTPIPQGSTLGMQGILRNCGVPMIPGRNRIDSKNSNSDKIRLVNLRWEKIDRQMSHRPPSVRA